MMKRILGMLSLLLIVVIGLISCTAGTGEDMLEDTTWVLESYGEPGNLKAVITNTEITAEFISAEESVKGSAGCNSYFGSYELKGSKISIPGPIAATEMYCAEPEGVMDQEQDYLAVLQLAESYEVDGDELQINCGSQVLIFKSNTRNISFECTLEAEETYVIGEPVNLRFSLHNQTERTLYILTWYTPLEGIAGEIFSITHDGDKVPYRGIMAKRGDPSRDDYVEVKPGAAVSAMVNLAEDYDLSQAGQYHVEFTSRLHDVTDDESLIPRKQDDHQPQELTCNTVSFEIVH